MKAIISLVLLSISLACCAGTEHEKPHKDDDKDDNQEVTNPNGVTLSADGKTDTYVLMLAKGFNYEVPDSSGTHAANHVKHISQVFDPFLGKYVFEFIIHINIDDDRGLPNITDRQRNEIKTDAKSPANMVGSRGETHINRWKFKLPLGFKPTKNFTHIHQIKGYGGTDIDMPLITFTARKQSNGSQLLQIIHVSPKPATTTTYLAAVPLSDFIDQWVEVCESATFDHNGKYEVTITRIGDKKELLHFVSDNIDLWRDGATAMRPKYGIYRSFGIEGSLKDEMQDEILRFADFSLKEEPKK